MIFIHGGYDAKMATMAIHDTDERARREPSIRNGNNRNESIIYLSEKN